MVVTSNLHPDFDGWQYSKKILTSLQNIDMKKNKSQSRWVLQAAIGLILTGSGLSLAIDAGITKLQGGEWFWYGTGALIVFQAGLCLVIDSTRFK